MNAVLSAAQMQAADKKAMVSLRITEKELMALAGYGCYLEIKKHFETLHDKRFLVFCGKGNNGGDGFVLTKHLLNHGAYVDVVLLGSISELKKEPFDALRILSQYLLLERNQERLRLIEDDKSIPEDLLQANYDGIIDAILGTGFISKPLSPLIEQAIAFCNKRRHQSTIIAIDIPTGIDATTGEKKSNAIRAHTTLCLAYLKTGLLINDGCAHSEKNIAIDISVPDFLIERDAWRMVDKEFVTQTLPKRKADSHKSQNGKALLIVGSEIGESSMMGAAILSASAAQKVGIGYLAIAVPQSGFSIIHNNIPEAIVCSQHMDELSEKIKWADAILIGCGLGLTKSSEDLVHWLITQEADKKIIIDADAITILAKNNWLPLLKNKNVLLTPHHQELKRLTNIEKINDSLSVAREFYATHLVNILLKGPATAVACNGKYYISNNGTEALATAGTGDILAGMITSLAAQGLSLEDAAGCSAWIHGESGRVSSQSIFAPTASEILFNLKNI